MQVPTTLEVNNSLFEQLQEAVQEELKPQEVKVVNVQKAQNQSKKNKKKITQEEILEEQYKALIAKQENLKLKKRKLELEVSLLEQKVCSVPGYQVSINLNHKPLKVNLSPKYLFHETNLCTFSKHIALCCAFLNHALTFHRLNCS